MSKDISVGLGMGGASAGMAASSRAELQAGATLGGIRMKSTYHFECFDLDGNLKWEETVDNLVVNVGLNDVLSKYFKGSAYTASFFVGLKKTGTIAAGDTMASHAGWVESATFSNATRPALTLGAVSAQSVDNSASKAVFNINGSDTIFGAFVTTDNTVSGTTGTLYGAADFVASRAVLSGDTINVTVTLTASAS